VLRQREQKYNSGYETQFGLEPAEAKMVVLKTASNWQYYQEMMSEVIRVDTPGMTMSHLESL